MLSKSAQQTVSIVRVSAAGLQPTRLIVAAATVAALLTLSGCGTPFWLPRAHKIEVQQGNLLTRDQIKAVKAGMLREEVAALIGVPVNQPAFQPERWDYVFTRAPAGKTVTARRFSVFFDKADKVENIQANFDQESGEIIMPKYWFSSIDERKPVTDGDTKSDS